MPKLLSAVPKYRRKKCRDGQPQAVVTLNGRDHYLGLYGSRASKHLYDQLIGQWLASGRSQQFGLVEDRSTILLRDLIVSYGKWAQQHYRRADGTPTGTHATMRPLMKWLLDWYGDQEVADFGPLAFRHVVRRRIERGLSITTVNDEIARIKHLFRWGVSHELVESLQLKAIEAVQGERRGRSAAKPRNEVLAVSDEHVRLTLQILPPIVATMVQLQRATGMRPQEVCDIAPDAIEQLDDVWIYRPFHHKNMHRGKERVVVLNRTAIQLLLPYMACRPYCFNPSEAARQHFEKRSARRVTPLSWEYS